MLIAIYEEPLLEPVVPAEAGWTSARKQARTMLAATRDSLAPEARIVVDSNPLVWRGLCRVSEREHRDPLAVGSGLRAGDGQVRLGERAQDLLYHLQCPPAIAPQGMSNRAEPRLEQIGVGFDDGRKPGSPSSWPGHSLCRREPSSRCAESWTTASSVCAFPPWVDSAATPL
jgi:hypothetical protein